MLNWALFMFIVFILFNIHNNHTREKIRFLCVGQCPVSKTEIHLVISDGENLMQKIVYESCKVWRNKREIDVTQSPLVGAHCWDWQNSMAEHVWRVEPVLLLLSTKLECLSLQYCYSNCLSYSNHSHYCRDLLLLLLLPPVIATLITVSGNWSLAWGYSPNVVIARSRSRKIVFSFIWLPIFGGLYQKSFGKGVLGNVVFKILVFYTQKSIKEQVWGWEPKVNIWNSSSLWLLKHLYILFCTFKLSQTILPNSMLQLNTMQPSLIQTNILLPSS